MNSKIQSKDVDFLFDAILQLQTRDECYMFFEDLCTVQELKALSQRIAVAKMLDDKCVYTDIEARTGASTATISRVNKCLKYGNEGYIKALERMELRERAARRK